MTNISFTTNEAAEFLDVTTNTIYQYIKQDILRPSNLEEFKYSREYKFTQEELERVQSLFKKPGLTTTEVGKLLNVKPHTVFTYIKEGKLPAVQKEYKGRMIYFIKEEDAAHFQQSLQQKQKVSRQSFYVKPYSVALYQLFTHEESHKKARIVELSKKEAIVQFDDGNIETVPLQSFTEQMFQPVYAVRKEKLHRKGKITFKFPKPRNIHAVSYYLIDLFFQQVGFPNMMIIEKNEMVLIEVKPLVLELSQEQSDVLDLMKQSLVDGELIEGPAYVRLISPMVPLHIKEIPRTLKDQIKEKAKKEQTSMEQAVIRILKDYFSKEGY